MKMKMKTAPGTRAPVLGRGASQALGPSSLAQLHPPEENDDGITHKVTSFSHSGGSISTALLPSSLQRSMVEVPCSMFTPPTTMPTSQKPVEAEEIKKGVEWVGDLLECVARPYFTTLF
jgi:hypothetical protein